MMVEGELCIQWVFARYSVDPVSTILISKSTFDLVSLKKMSPKMRMCVNDDTTIAGVGQCLGLHHSPLKNQVASRKTREYWSTVLP